MVRPVGEVSSTVSSALPRKIRPHAMLVIVVEACNPGMGGIRKDAPNSLSVKCHELIRKSQDETFDPASHVNSTGA